MSLHELKCNLLGVLENYYTLIHYREVIEIENFIVDYYNLRVV